MIINKTIKKPELVPAFPQNVPRFASFSEKSIQDSWDFTQASENVQASACPADRISCCLCRILPADLYKYEPVLLCIGTPEITGDSLGPLVGSILEPRTHWPIFGTLERPVHAMNFARAMDQIHYGYERPYIIAVDAALGHPRYEGLIAIKKGPVRPGEGLGKKLPPVGNVHVTGIFSKLEGSNAQILLKQFASQIAQGLLSAAALYR